MISFFFVQFFYLLIKRVRLFNSYKHRLLNLIKLKVFTIAGQCKHSGYCCNSILISDQGIEITNIKNWTDFITKNPTFSRFRPSLFNGNIQSFNCDCLQYDFKCSDYDNRPQMCRDYPKSYFLSYGKTYAGCGFQPVRNDIFYRRTFSSIRKELDLFFSNDL